MSAASLLTSNDLHPAFGKQSAASSVLYAVDGHAAFKADSHAAKRPARLPINRSAKLINSGKKDGGGDRCALRDRDSLVVYLKLDQCASKSLAGA